VVRHGTEHLEATEGAPFNEHGVDWSDVEAWARFKSNTDIDAP
jgi:hypothetical protein